MKKAVLQAVLLAFGGLLFFVAIALESVGCSGSPQLGVEVNGQQVEVVDIHFHPGEWKDIPKPTQRYLSSRFPFPFSLTPESLAESIIKSHGIVAEMDKAGIRVGILLAVYAPKTVGVSTNEFVSGQVKEIPERLLGLASLRVDNWAKDKDKELTALRKALSNPSMVGIKIAHAHQHFRMDDPRYYGIYQISAEMKKPVYLHTGSSPFPGISLKASYTDPAYLEDAIKKHPKAIFILGHLGFDFANKKIGELKTCLRMAKTYPNVYLEPSAMGAPTNDPDGSFLNQVMKEVKAAGVINKMIYGSDGPQSPGFAKSYLERTMAAMKNSGYTTEEVQKVLSGNFYRVFTSPIKPSKATK